VELTEARTRIFCAEGNALSHFQLLGGPHESEPAVFPLALVQHAFDTRDRISTAACAIQSCRNHARIIDDDDIARLQNIRQVANDTILHGRIIRGNIEKTRRIARLCRAQRNAIFRQFKIEEVDFHFLSHPVVIANEAKQ
jgi:hypothetical protein